jgi:hypothetical protein
LEDSICGTPARAFARERRACRRFVKNRLSGGGSWPCSQCTVTAIALRSRAPSCSSNSARVVSSAAGFDEKQMRVARGTPSTESYTKATSAAPRTSLRTAPRRVR